MSFIFKFETPSFCRLDSWNFKVDFPACLINKQPDGMYQEGILPQIIGNRFRLILVDVPLVIEWFANIDNPQTRSAYKDH